MRRLVALAALPAVVSLVAAGAAASGGGHRTRSRPALPPLGTASSFFLTELDEKLHGDWHDAWRSLYPLHQAIAPEATYVLCERKTRFPAPLQSLTIEGVVPAQVRGPELEQPVRGVALNVLVKLRWYGPRDPIVFRHVFHLVPVEGRWTWLLAAPEYDAYRAGRCPVEKSVAA